MRTLLTLIILALLSSCHIEKEGDAINWSQIENDIGVHLEDGLLASWYPAILDTVEGGYLSNLSASFAPLEAQEKMIVTQSRHLWTTSKVALRTKDQQYLNYAAHGFRFLQKLWDPQHGGFYQNMDRKGQATDSLKTAYGNAFAIYGLSAYYEASGDENALALARETFLWLEAHSHDEEYGGYFQIMDQSGNVIPLGQEGPSYSPAGLKDQNSSIHLLEAFTSLYAIWPDALVRERLTEMYELVKDVMFNDDHYLNLFFYEDWTPISHYGKERETILKEAELDHVSFGHDIETAYLLLEASEALDIPHDQELLNELKLIVDHALLGIDPNNGGLFDQGYDFDRQGELEIIKDSKAWWAQAEALNTLLIFHRFYPAEGYDLQFIHMWRYIQKYVIDQERGGWYTSGIDTRPEAKDLRKAQVWKSTYHNYRALANILELLEHGH